MSLGETHKQMEGRIKMADPASVRMNGIQNEYDIPHFNLDLVHPLLHTSS